MGSGVYRSEGCPGNGKASPGQRGRQSLAVDGQYPFTFGRENGSRGDFAGRLHTRMVHSRERLRGCVIRGE
jgi:hypothetical protein